MGARTMLKADKDDAEARRLLGQLELQRGNVNRAVGQLRAAVRTNPESAQAHYFLARALGHQNRTEEAMESYRRALALEDYAEAHHDFAIALRSVGRSEEAMQHLRDAIRVSPDLIQARMNLGLMLLARNRLDEATDQFRQTIAHTAEFADAHYYLGVALHRAERTEEALESLARSIAVEFAPHGIRCNVIQPGITETPALAAIPGSDQIKAQARMRNPFHRLTTPIDVANAIYLFSLDDAAWMNGAVIRVDGGEHISGVSE